MKIVMKKVSSVEKALANVSNSDTFISEARQVLRARTPDGKYAPTYREWFKAIERSMNIAGTTKSGFLYSVVDAETNRLLGIYSGTINRRIWYFNWAYRAPDALDSLAWATSEELLNLFSDQFLEKDIDEVVWDSDPNDTGHQAIDDAVATADGNKQSDKREENVKIKESDTENHKRRIYKFDKADKIAKKAIKDIEKEAEKDKAGIKK